MSDNDNDNEPETFQDRVNEIRRQRTTSFTDPPIGVGVGEPIFDDAVAGASRPSLGERNTSVGNDSETATDLGECQCGWPDLALDKDTVGPSLVQILYCDRCDHRFHAVVSEDDGEEDDE